MPRRLYDLLPPEVRAQYPPESLDAPAAKLLLDPAGAPDELNPATAEAAGRIVAQYLPRMTAMRSMTNRVRAGQRGELGLEGIVPNAPGPADRPAPTTANLLESAPPVIRHGARVLFNMAQAPAGVLGVVAGQPPEQRFSAAAALPPARTKAERVEDFAGNVAGFTLATMPLALIPGVSPVGAAGAVAAAQEHDLKSAAISGVTTAAAAGAAGRLAQPLTKAVGRLTGVPSGAPAWVRPSPVASAAGHLPGAVAFGAAQPLTAAAMHRLTGEPDYPMPGPEEWAKGTGEMIAVALVSGALGRARSLAANADPRVVRHAELVARAVRPPAGVDPARSKAFTDALNAQLAGKRIMMNLPDGPGQGEVTVQRVFAYRAPGGLERITVLVSDPLSKVPVPIRFDSGQQLVDAIGARPRIGEGVGGVQVPAAEVERAAQGRTSPAAVAEQRAEVEARLARLEKNAPPKGDKGYRRWAQRVERLRAERDRLGAAAPSPAPSPAAVPPEAGGARITPPTERPLNYRQMANEDILGLAGRGDAQARAEWQRRQAKGAPPEAPPAAPPPSAPPPEPAKPVGPPVAPAEGGPGSRAPEPSAGSPTPAEAPVRYDPSTDKYSGGGLKNGDLLTDGKDVFRVTRRSGYTVEVDKRTENGWKVAGSRSVDPTSPDFRGDLRRTTEGEPGGKPLEQQSLGGMPAPKIPGGAKRAAFDESADIVKAMGAEPEPSRQTGLDFSGAGDAGPPAGESRFKVGASVRVPNENGRGHDTRDYVDASVVGYDTVGGEPAVVVEIQRGGSVERSVVPERLARLRPTMASRKAAAAERNAADSKLKASIRERIGGDFEAAQRLMEEYAVIAQKAADRVPASERDAGGPAEYKRTVASARAAWRRANRVVELAREIRDEIGDTSFDPDAIEKMPPLSPEQEAAIAGGAEGRGDFLMARPARPAGQSAAPARLRTTPALVEPSAAPPVPRDTRNLPEASIPVGRSRGALAPPKGLEAFGEGMAKVWRDVVSVASPLSLVSARAQDIVFKEKGRTEAGAFRVSRLQRDVERYWNGRTHEQVMRFWDDYENGRPMDARHEPIAEQYRQRSDNLFRAVAHYKDIPYWDNWFPHMWKDPSKASRFFAGRRPMEGNKSFTKNRLYSDIRAGIKAGLEPVSWNPETLMQMAEHNVRKFVMVQRLKRVLKGGGLMKFGRLGSKAGDGRIPEGFTTLNQNWTKVYLNPVKEVSEYFDQQAHDVLQRVGQSIGAKMERKMNLGTAKGVLGFSKARPGEAGKVVTRFATPLSVMAHELSHAIDAKFGLKDVLLTRVTGKGSTAENRIRRTMDEELDKLAALRYEGHTPDKKFRDYVHSNKERMAVILEALSYIPDRFKDIAPVTHGRVMEFFDQHPELQPLKDIKRGLVYGENTAEMHAGGAVLGGEWWVEENLARILDNHMSRDWVMESQGGRTAMASRNFLNAIQLGISGFHLTNLTFISAMNRASIGVNQVLHGNAEGLRTIARSALAPKDYLAEGHDFYRRIGAPDLERLERDIFTGGAKLGGHLYYNEGSFENFKAQVEAHGLAKAAAGDPRGALQSAVEASQRVLAAYAERLKVGAFRELLAGSLQNNAARLASGEVTRETLAREAWTNVEARLGLLNYDNLFWNRALRTSIQLLVRAPGWRWGTIHQIFGAPVDAARQGARLVTGKRAEVTDRMAFAATAILTQLAIGGIYHYLHTGKPPKDYQDYRFPENGQTDAKGQPVRVDFPTDLKTAEGWAEAGGDILTHKQGGVDKLWRRSGIAPEVAMMNEFIRNEDWRGKPLHDPKDPAGKQAADMMKWAFGSVTPFSFQQQGELGGQKPSPGARVEAFMGVTRHREPSKIEWIRVPKKPKGAKKNRRVS